MKLTYQKKINDLTNEIIDGIYELLQDNYPGIMSIEPLKSDYIKEISFETVFANGVPTQKRYLKINLYGGYTLSQRHDEIAPTTALLVYNALMDKVNE